MNVWRARADDAFVTVRLNLCRWLDARIMEKITGIDGGEIQMDLSFADADADALRQSNRALPRPAPALGRVVCFMSPAQNHPLPGVHAGVLSTEYSVVLI